MYRRNLPHWHPEGAVFFVTWRLFRSLPASMDQPSVADCVAQTILAAEVDRRICSVHAFVVMPNHVHLLTTPAKPLREVTRWIKGVSARRANQLLNRTGEPFWQDESFDHWVRSAWEFEKIQHYIAQNPVRAGLVSEPSQWRHSMVRCGTGFSL